MRGHTRTARPIRIRLPGVLKPFVERRVSAGGYRSPSAYVEKLILEDKRRAALAGLPGEPLPVDEQFPARLEALLKEAAQSGEATPMTPQDWDDIRREGLALLQVRKRI